MQEGLNNEGAGQPVPSAFGEPADDSYQGDDESEAAREARRVEAFENRKARRVEAVEAAFLEERPSRVGRDLESKIKDALAAPSVSGVVLDEIECRTSRCKLQMTFDDVAANRRVMGQVFMSGDIDLAGFAPHQTQLPDGRLQVTLYLYPDGA